jgi:hypothetical protein
MGRQRQMIGEFLQENQLLGGEIMGIVDNQAFHAKADHNVDEPKFALAPSSPRQPQGFEQITAERSLFLIIFGGGDGQDGIAASREGARGEARRADQLGDAR